KVVELAAQLIPGDRKLRANQYRLPVKEHGSVMPRVPLAGDHLLGWGQAQLLGRVLAEQLVQLEAAEVRTAQERLRDKLREETQVGARDRERGVAIEAAAEHGQPRERGALVVGQQLPRLVDGGSQAPMSFRHVTHRRGQEVDAALD